MARRGGTWGAGGENGGVRVLEEVNGCYQIPLLEHVLAERGKVMTIGEWKVGISFNPSRDRNVEKIKVGAAQLIDFVIAMRSELTEANAGAPGSGELNAEINRLCALAMTGFEEAAMWAVKAATKQPL